VLASITIQKLLMYITEVAVQTELRTISYR